MPVAEAVDPGLTSAEKINAALSAKPRRKSMTSLYLKFSETAPDGKSRRCKFCKQSYSMATATGNLGRHLNHRHPEYDRQQGDDVPQQNSQSIAYPTATKKLQIQTKVPHVDHDNLNLLLIKWFIGGSLPLLTVDDESLTNCLKFLNPSIKIWPVDHVHTIIYDVFRSMQDDIKRNLDHVNSKFSIAIDFWASYDQAYGTVDAVVYKYEDTLGFRDILLNSTEKNVMSIMHTFLEPFYKTTTNICTSKSPIIGLVLFFMDHITDMIIVCRDARGTPEWLKTGADCIAQKAASYSSQVQHPYTYVAAVLDPRIKGELLPENMNGENCLEDARNHFMQTYANHVPVLSIGIFSGLQDNDSGGRVSFAEEIARKKRRRSISSATDELTQILAEPTAPISTDVFEWWKVNSTRYPRLSAMARDYLGIQGTSVTTEEVLNSKSDDIE